jgi:hypothetical protein
VHVANTFVIITDKGKDEKQTGREEWERDVFWLVDCKKNRDGAKFWFRVRHHVLVGRVTEEIEEASGAAGAATMPAGTASPPGAASPLPGADGDEIETDPEDADGEAVATDAEAEAKREAGVAAMEGQDDGKEVREGGLAAGQEEDSRKKVLDTWRKSREKTQCSDEGGDE